MHCSLFAQGDRHAPQSGSDSAFIVPISRRSTLGTPVPAENSPEIQSQGFYKPSALGKKSMMHTLVLRFCLISGLTLIISQPCPAKSRIDFDSKTMKQLEISDQIDIYLDTKARTSIGEVLAPEFSGFIRSAKDFPSFGAFLGNNWFRFIVKNDSNQPQKIILSLESYVLQTDLFEKPEFGQWQTLGSA